MKILSPVGLKQKKKKKKSVFIISRSLFIQRIGEKECHSPTLTGELWLKFSES